MTRVTQFTFGEPEFTFFEEDERTPRLSRTIWYKTAEGKNWYTGTDCSILNNAAKSPEEALECALQHTTAFVRERWFLIEVITPMRLFSYGFPAEGGLPRFRAVRSVEPTSSVDTKPIETNAASAA